MPKVLTQTLTKVLAAGGIAVALFAAPQVWAQEIPEWAAPMQEGATADRERGSVDAESMDDPPPFPTPLDPAGLALLAVAGGALAARRLRMESTCNSELGPFK